MYPVRVLILALVLTSFTILPVWAGVYKWVDETGKVHYTNNKAKIPRKKKYLLSL